MDISIIGLGKLGSSMAAAIASRGHQVVGVDINEASVKRLSEGKAPVLETDLELMIAEHKNSITATMDFSEAVCRSQISFIIVPTPSDSRGAFSLQHAIEACSSLGAALRTKAGYHLFVLTSTVLPGSCRYGLIPALERASGKKVGIDFGFCYSPEFIALGSIIKDYLEPDFTLVGQFDEKSGSRLEEFIRTVKRGGPCRRMSIENAELAKVALNSYVTMKISFANMLTQLCELIPGGNVDVVSATLGSDERIGSKYLKGGLGFGGPCFPRDNLALSFFADYIGADPDLPVTTHKYNEKIPRRISAMLQDIIEHNQTVAVLGLAYKPKVYIADESQSITIANELVKSGARVFAHDPTAGESARVALHTDIVLCDSLQECLHQADVVVITTNDPVYMELRAVDFLQEGKTIVVIDCWRLLEDELSGFPGIKYMPLGHSVQEKANITKLKELWSAA